MYVTLLLIIMKTIGNLYLKRKEAINNINLITIFNPLLCLYAVSASYNEKLLANC